MITLFFHPSPNPLKIALYLEETGTPYQTVAIDTRKGDQHTPEFLAINPNGKTPALLDDDIPVFDSTAILLYLAEKTGQFMPAGPARARAEMYSWMMLIATGIGPYSGQAVHFRLFAPEPKAYALNRYDYEAWRHWELIEARLAGQRYLLDDYSVVDMALWGWARMIPRILGSEHAWARLPNVKRLLDEISARPAAQRAEALKTRFSFKDAVDDEARRHLFPSNLRLV